VKHSASSTTHNPQTIAKSVRFIVEAFLHRTPGAVDSRFAERIEKLAANVALWGSRMNLTAHPEDPEEIAFHVIDSLMPVVLASGDGPLHGAFDEGSSVLDLGSGAGFPGLVLAAASSANFTLVESRRKRASFLQVAMAEMALDNVRVDSTRAAPSAFKGEYDLVTARAFGDGADFFAVASAALKPNGLAMLYASSSQRLNLEAARASHFADYSRVPYVVPRREERVERILAIWRKGPSY
jgi:16S rRNA (guanine527-N7)-methyltransferase